MTLYHAIKTAVGDYAAHEDAGNLLTQFGKSLTRGVRSKKLFKTLHAEIAAAGAIESPAGHASQAASGYRASNTSRYYAVPQENMLVKTTTAFASSSDVGPVYCEAMAFYDLERGEELSVARVSETPYPFGNRADVTQTALTAAAKDNLTDILHAVTNGTYVAPKPVNAAPIPTDLQFS